MHTKKHCLAIVIRYLDRVEVISSVPFSTFWSSGPWNILSANKIQRLKKGSAPKNCLKIFVFWPLANKNRWLLMMPSLPVALWCLVVPLAIWCCVPLALWRSWRFWRTLAASSLIQTELAAICLVSIYRSALSIFLSVYLSRFLSKRLILYLDI